MSAKNKREKIVKIFLWLVASLLFFIVVLILVIEFLFPEKLVKSQLKSYLNDTYNLDVDFNDLNISLFKGLEISDFKIKNYQNHKIEDGVLCFNKLYLYYKFSDLLNKKITITSFELSNPSLNLIKDKNGILNVTDIIERFTKGNSETVKTKQIKSDNSSSNLSFNVRNFKISNIDFKYHDRQNKDSLAIQGLNLDVPVLSLENNNFLAKTIISLNNQDLYAYFGLEKIILTPNINITAFLQNNLLDFNLDINIDKIKLNLPSYLEFNKQLKDNILFRFEGSFNLVKQQLLTKEIYLNILNLLTFNSNLELEKASYLKLKSKDKTNLSIDLYKTYNLLKETKFSYLVKDIKLKKSKFIISDLNYDLELDSLNMNCSLNSKLNLFIDEFVYKDYKILNLNNDLNLKAGLGSSQLYIKRFDYDLSIAKIKTPISQIKSIDKLKFNLKPKFTKNIIPNSFTALLKLTIPNIQNIETSVDLKLLKNLTIDDFKQLTIDDYISLFKISINSKIKNINLSKILDLAKLQECLFDFNQKIDLNRGKFLISGDLPIDTLVINEDPIHTLSLLSKKHLTYNLKGNLGKSFNNIYLKSLIFKLSNLFSITLDKGNFKLPTKDLLIEKLTTNLNLKNIVESLRKSLYLKDENIDFNTGDFSLDISNIEYKLSSFLPNIKNMLISLYINDFIYDKHKIESLKFRQNISCKNSLVNLYGKINVNGLQSPKLLAFTDYLQEINFENEMSINLKDSLPDGKIKKLNLQIPYAKFNSFSNGDFKLINNQIMPNFNLNMFNDLKLQKYNIVSGLENIKGKFNQNITLKSNHDKLDLFHEIIFDSLNATMFLDSSKSKSIKFSNLEGVFPIKLSATIFKKKNMSFKLNNLTKTNNFKTIHLDSVIYRTKQFRQKVDDIYLKLFIDNNGLAIDEFRGETLGGNFLGKINFALGIKNFDQHFSVEKLQEMSLIKSSFIFSGINTGLILKQSQNNNENSKDLNVNMKLDLKGLNLQKDYKFNGNLNLSRLSEKDARNLLDFMERNTQDPSISLLKSTISTTPGLKLNLFSFKIKDNFITTKIHLYKPWYLFYLPLPEQISFSKQPISFYIEKYVN